MTNLENTQRILNSIFNYDITETIIKKLMRPHNSDKIQYCNDQIINLHENYNYHVMAYKRNSCSFKPPSEFYQYILIKNNIKKKI